MFSNMMKNKGFQALPERKNAKMRLFCFPYGGGSGNVFRTWAKSLPEEVEVIAFTLPGRGSRVKEQNLIEWQTLVDELEKAFLSYLDKPYYFFGHSLGACIAFELSKRLQAKNMLMPLQLFISGCQPPHIPAFKFTTHNLPKDEFFDCIFKMNGTPIEVLQDVSLMKILEPTFYAPIFCSPNFGLARLMLKSKHPLQR
jgi:medium-chain acyl-[acyl-carrier-protein] hydrolase